MRVTDAAQPATLKDCIKEESKSEPAKEASLIEPIPVSDPYYVQVKFSMLDGSGEDQDRVIKAVVDPGSPVSLVKCGVVPEDLQGPTPPNGDNFCGMNKSCVRVLGTFTKKVVIEGIEINIRFLVVPNETMSCEMLLGRDFSRSPLVRVELGETIKVLRNSIPADKIVNQTMQIEYLESPVKVNEELNVNPDIDTRIVEEVKNLYEGEYVAKRDLDAKEPEPKMKILLKKMNNQSLFDRDG